jgi:hypothetical protein
MQTLMYPDYSLDFRFVFESYSSYKDPVIIKTEVPDIELHIHQNANDFYVGIFQVTPMCDIIIGIVNLKRQFGRTALGDNVYEPHSYLDKNHRRKGYMSSVYSWILSNGFTLLSCGRQTFDSESLWGHLSNSFEFGYYDTRLNEIITCEINQMMLESSNVCAFLRKKEVINGTANQVSAELACEA